MRSTWVVLVGLLALPMAAAAAPVPLPAGGSTLCAAPAAPVAPLDYYAVELVPTGRVPGTRTAEGRAVLTFARSPFGVSLSSAGAYTYSADIEVTGIRPRHTGAFVVWAASADLEHVERLGVLDETFRVSGRIAWNKFLVIVSLEPSAEPGDRWQGPIVMRGMSRSGMMHTMAGHGAYQSEPCIKYGYR